MSGLMNALVPVVLCGGSGTRLWPLSREMHPKQLLRLLGDSSLLQATLDRVTALPGFAVGNPIVVSNEAYRFVVAEQLRLIGREATLLLEPVGRNTAPALTLAALAAQEGGDDPVLLVMPSDHLLTDLPAFRLAAAEGARLAAAGHVVTFGVPPERAETGYGYIAVGEPLDQAHGRAPGAWHIDRFVEKPDLATAQGFVEQGGYWWNSGLFMVRASVWLEAIAHCRADILQACNRAWSGASRDMDFVRVEATTFASCPSESIDYAVMERLSATAVVSGEDADDAESDAALPTGVVLALRAGWSDVGGWESLWQALPKDDEGNAVRGDTLLHGTRNTLVMAESRLVACVGLDDLIVVETADAVLVARKSHSQQVKAVVERLRQSARPEGQFHRKVHRPWGWFDSVDEGERFKVKRIVVRPGGTLSLQMHHHRAEHWVVVRGTARVTRGEETFLLSENESTFIPLGITHRLTNPGRLDLEMVEVQSGSYLGEDDIVRLSDVYQR